jgi:hypothetical protein
MINLTAPQETAIACAFADLQGIIQIINGSYNIADIDADAIQATIDELVEQFPEICIEYPNGDDEIGDGMTDVEADADTLRSAGMGTDEDYGGGDGCERF